MKYSIRIVTTTMPGKDPAPGERTITAENLSETQLRTWIDSALSDAGLVTFAVGVDRRG